MAIGEIIAQKTRLFKFVEWLSQFSVSLILGDRKEKQALYEIEKVCQSGLKLKQLTVALSNIFLEYLDLERIVFVLKIAGRQYLMISQQKGIPATLKKVVFNEKAEKYLAGSDNFLAEQEILDFFNVLPVSFLNSLGRKTGSDLVMPLQFSQGNNGFILFSRKITNKRIFSREVQWINNAVEFSSASLENSWLRYKLRKSDLRLKNVVATKDLKLKKVVQAQGEYFSELSHEMKTPLAIMKNYLLVAAEGEKLNLEAVVSQVQTLSQLVEDIVFLAKLDSGYLKLERGFVNVTALVDNIRQELEVITASRGITFKNFCQKGIVLSADQANLKKALFHIILNAVLYNHKKGMVEVYTHQNESGVKIVILDTGAGMSPKDSKQAFDRFYHSNNPKNTRCQGNGLGLSIAQQIIKKHAGEIEIKSEKGKGTAVVIKLPG
ncbi:MAG: HAMP domain-containing sensor histidine kinase [Patescibacteria group bacterium]|nr:HAMP domain-containing sensor histidine kinase [Patescibacteria group bacterium]